MPPPSLAKDPLLDNDEALEMAAQTFKLAAEKLELKRQLDHAQTLYSDTKCDLLSAQAGLARALREAGGAVEQPTTSTSSSSGGCTFHVAAGNPVEHVPETEQEARPPKRRRKEHQLGPARWARRQERAQRFQQFMESEERRWNNMTLDAFNRIVFGDDPVAAAEADQALWDDPEI